jgi:glyoxylase-like metal-dependent hydrolase (beta-lactamase superfamily II)
METPSVSLDQHPEVTAFFDGQSNTFSYVIKDPASASCAVIDAVMQFDYPSARLSFESADAIIAFITDNNLTLEWIIETHVHADHLSGAPYIQQKLGGKIGIGEHILEVQETFGKIFNAGTEFQRDGSQFDRLFTDNEIYQVGSLNCFAMHTPGHTPACMVHVMGDTVFTGDTLFMPDGGSARADFPGGDAGELFDSITRVLALPDEMRLFVCHDYGPDGRAIEWETTIGAQKAANIHVGGSATREEFVAMRETRDATLNVPNLIIPSLQVNMRAGEVPRDEDGNMTLSVPIDKL